MEATAYDTTMRTTLMLEDDLAGLLQQRAPQLADELEVDAFVAATRTP